MNDISINFTDAVMQALNEEAKSADMDVSEVIKVIVTEWVLRNEIIKKLQKF